MNELHQTGLNSQILPGVGATFCDIYLFFNHSSQFYGDNFLKCFLEDDGERA